MSVPTTVEVSMPQMGDSVTEGTVLEWHKQEGDLVKENETLVEISTDKVDTEIPAPASGRIIKIRAEEGETIRVGAVLVEIAASSEQDDEQQTSQEPSGSSSSALTGPSVTGSGAPATSNEAETNRAKTDQTTSGTGPSSSQKSSTASVNGASQKEQIVDVTMPTMGESVTEGTILEWAKQVGETVTEEDTLVEISTDKVDAEVPSPVTGVVTEHLAKEGDTVTVGQVIARVESKSLASASESKSGLASTSTANTSTTSTSPSTPESISNDKTSATTSSVNASPVARRVADAHQVNLSQVSGTGPAGRIYKADVIAAAGSTTAQSAAAGDGKATTAVTPDAQATPLRGGAAMLARYMNESLTIPTATSIRTMSVSTLDSRRQELKAAGKRVSFTHLIAFAIAKAVNEMPVMAAHFAEIDGKPNRIDDGKVNLGIAVDVERKDGGRTLMVPVIRDAGRLSFTQFLDAFNDLITRARENQLTADDLTGANISLTNPGGIGTIASVPRLMSGQGTIVATGAIGFPPGLEKIGRQIGAEKVLTLTSTYDHRIIQGAESGQFLQLTERYLQGESGFYEEVFGDLSVTPSKTEAKTVQEPVATPATAEVSTTTTEAFPNEALLRAVQSAVSLLKAHRMHGHLAARLDPLGSEPEHDPALDPESVELTPELMAQIPTSILRTWVKGTSLLDALPYLREIYCGTIAYEIEHISSHRQRTWLREKIESEAYRQPLNKEEKRRLLRSLTKVDSLERFMHKAYLGQKQFSLEGLDMTVPMLDEMIELAGNDGARDVVLGMAHRGRLNVLAHNLGRSYETIFREFEGAQSIEAVTTIPQGGTGDVKYHHGAQGTYELEEGRTVTVRLESNPSHLEYVDPVVEGATRAIQTVPEGSRTRLDHKAAIAIILHGDASFPAQGVVAETLNLQGLDGYTVGGTVHIIQNNQVGFTTEPDDARSTRWASDLAKGFDVPIIHVNADDVSACISAVRLAFAFRQEFGHDVLIDLIGYRRYGHNEGDEPAYTQPEMAAAIKKKLPVRELFARSLIEDGTATQEEVEALSDEIWQKLTEQHHRLKEELKETPSDQPLSEYSLDRTASPEPQTSVPRELLRTLNEELYRIPPGFSVHPKLLRQIAQRLNVLGPNGGIDWAHAEALAFASLLSNGNPIRLTGQDTERGTFSQRHLVFHDHKTGQQYSPIQHLPSGKAPMQLHNSPLSEVACVGFEYGYSQEAMDTLVLWEAQFGDFVNSAQVIIDQFIVSGLAKWGQTSRLTLLLPHGYEGSGPEHSSTRIERFLQLAAEGNMRLAVPTTPAQYFHLLRRQALVAKRRPLIVATPKSLLRLPQATSRIDNLADGSFKSVLSEPDGVVPEKVTRLLLCSGKIYYDLKSHTAREQAENVAISRIELLYPFPQHEILEEIEHYPNLKQVVWVQEEPRNMGARSHMSPRLMQILPEHLEFGYIGRPERASTGEGYPAAHTLGQNRLIRDALDFDSRLSPHPIKDPGLR